MRDILRNLGSTVVWAFIFFFFVKLISVGYDQAKYAITGVETPYCESIAEFILP